MGQALARPVRIENDANCFALSEATDGAGAGSHVVWAVILGTGAGSGIAIDGKVLGGPHRIAGEWGHNPLPRGWRSAWRRLVVNASSLPWEVSSSTLQVKPFKSVEQIRGHTTHLWRPPRPERFAHHLDEWATRPKLPTRSP